MATYLSYDPNTNRGELIAFNAKGGQRQIIANASDLLNIFQRISRTIWGQYLGQTLKPGKGQWPRVPKTQTLNGGSVTASLRVGNSGHPRVSLKVGKTSRTYDLNVFFNNPFDVAVHVELAKAMRQKKVIRLRVL